MSDTSEDYVVNGRVFKLQIRAVLDGDRERWFGWITVDGKESQQDGSWSVGPCLSEVELRYRAEQTMGKYRS